MTLTVNEISHIELLPRASLYEAQLVKVIFYGSCIVVLTEFPFIRVRSASSHRPAITTEPTLYPVDTRLCSGSLP